MPKTKHPKSALHQFIDQRVAQLHTSKRCIAQDLHINPNTFKDWVRRGVLPERQIARIARQLDVAEETLESYLSRVTLKSGGRVKEIHKVNLVPMLRNIIASGETQIMRNELLFLAAIQLQRTTPIPVSDITELLKKRRGR